MLAEPLAVTIMVSDALEALGVDYVLGGSLASAVHGVMRATMDADLVADLDLAQVDPFVQALGEAFYLERNTVRQAVRARSSFNLIHLETLFKVDVFVARARPFDRAQLSRRQRIQIGEDPGCQAYVASAEDTVLAKLEGYRIGGEVSARQWRDVIGILQVQADRLDLEYVRRMAAELGVVDLLDGALQAAGLC